MDTPILLITFNRPSHTRRVLERIKEIRPKSLYIFQDGARISNSEDFIKINNVRQVINDIVDWPCNLNTFFSEDNLGCGPGPAKAISWFFEENEYGIIIEDDALPHPDFFSFADELLIKYRTSEKVMAIGSMKINDKQYGDGSYYFSKMNHTLCAWATWRRAWEKFNIDLPNITRKSLNKRLKEYGAKLREREYWCERLDEIHLDRYGNSSWDQQFWITIWMNRGKGILPNVNLCSNIGFDDEGTHTINPNSTAANIPSKGILPIVSPSSEAINKKADYDFQREYFQPWVYGTPGFKNLPFRINKRIKRLVGHQGPWIKKKKKN